MSEIILSSVKNIRDFSGYITKDGRTPKKGNFIRSRMLYSLSEKDAEKLVDLYHIRTVIDLRTEEEAKEKPDPFLKDVKYINIPVISSEMAGITHEENVSQEKLADMELPRMEELYRAVVSSDFAAEALKKVFETIYERCGEGAVLWHCTEGKDRCGIVSALFLSLMGMDRETVTKDYLLTNRYNRRRARMYYFLVLISKRSRKIAKKIHGLFIADKQYLDAAFEVIDERYYGVDAFLKDRLGVTDEMKEKLKERFLE